MKVRAVKTSKSRSKHTDPYRPVFSHECILLKIDKYIGNYRKVGSVYSQESR